MHKKGFAAAGVELPSGKVMHTGRVVGMNDLKDKGAKKSDVTTTSGHKATAQNSEIAQEHYFSMCPPSVMHIASGVNDGEDWHVSRTVVPTFGTDVLFFAQLSNWRSQMLSEHGDKTKASKHHMFEFIPYCQRVTSQDGKFVFEYLH